MGLKKTSDKWRKVVLTIGKTRKKILTSDEKKNTKGVKENQHGPTS